MPINKSGAKIIRPRRINLSHRKEEHLNECDTKSRAVKFLVNNIYI